MLGHQQVFQHGELLEKAHVLEGAHQAVTGHLMAGLAGDLVAIQPDAAPGGPVEPADAVEDGGLAGAVGADDAEDLAIGDVEADVVDGGEAAEATGDVGAGDGVHRDSWMMVSVEVDRLSGRALRALTPPIVAPYNQF